MILESDFKGPLELIASGFRNRCRRLLQDIACDSSKSLSSDSQAIALIWLSKSWNRFHLNFEFDFTIHWNLFDSWNRFLVNLEIDFTWFRLHFRRSLKHISDDSPNRFVTDFRWLLQSISIVPWNHYQGRCKSMSVETVEIGCRDFFESVSGDS